MKILQIACGFTYSNVYRNFFEELFNQNIEIKVYVPQHYDPTVKNIDTEAYRYPIYSNKILNKLDKYLYFTKIYKMKKDVQSNFELNEIKLIHAHSLFSDGAVAYKLYKEYGIPYIVAVRDTDVNQYFKKAKHLNAFAIKILKHASSIIFLSKSYRNKVLKEFVPQRLYSEFVNKSEIIPNGISNYWLDNLFIDKPRLTSSKKNINLLLVAQIIKRKNIEAAIEVTKELNNTLERRFRLTVIGDKKDPNYFEDLLSLGKFRYIEYCVKEELISHYRESDIFILPSLTETFGLVYAEALSQGLPVLYSEGQGFDGQFDDGVVGYKVSPRNIEQIKGKIIEIIDRYNHLSASSLNGAKEFNWSLIVERYKKLYNIYSIK